MLTGESLSVPCGEVFSTCEVYKYAFYPHCPKKKKKIPQQHYARPLFRCFFSKTSLTLTEEIEGEVGWTTSHFCRPSLYFFFLRFSISPPRVSLASNIIVHEQNVCTREQHTQLCMCVYINIYVWDRGKNPVKIYIFRRETTNEHVLFNRHNVKFLSVLRPLFWTFGTRETNHNKTRRRFINKYETCTVGLHAKTSGRVVYLQTCIQF